MQKINLKSGLKYIILGGIAITIIIIARLNCGSTKTVEYDFFKVRKGDVVKTISASGVLEFDQTASVLCKENGIIEKVYVKLNQKVRKGQMLAKMDSSSLDQERLKAAVALEGAKVDLMSAKKDLQSNRSMFKESLISKQAMQNAEYNYKKVLYKYKQIQIDYTRIAQKKKNTVIVAPVSGTVYEMTKTTNTPARLGEHLFTIAPDLKKMILAINIDESDIGSVKKGLIVNFTVSAYPKKQFTGLLKEVHMNPLRKSNIVFYRSVVACDNKELLLKPGMTATATVIIDKKTDVLHVLNQAFNVNPEAKKIDIMAKEKYLWKKVSGLVGAQKIKKVEIETGLEGNLYTEILSGVKNGDEVLLNINEIQD